MYRSLLKHKTFHQVVWTLLWSMFHSGDFNATKLCHQKI